MSTETKCLHCGRKISATISLIARLSGIDQIRHDFCSLKCTRLWIMSQESPVLIRDVLQKKEEAEKAPIPTRPIVPVQSVPPVIEMVNPTPSKLAEAIGIRTFQVIAELMERNCFATMHTVLFLSDAHAVCKKHGFIFLERFDEPKTQSGQWRKEG